MRQRYLSIIALGGALALCLAGSGCFTMHFENDGADRDNEFSEWHHGGILRLVEFSEPVDLRERCNGVDANSHTVEQGFLNGLASGISYGLYDGWTVEVDCP